jgi:hypothetical protein
VWVVEGAAVEGVVAVDVEGVVEDEPDAVAPDPG